MNAFRGIASAAIAMTFIANCPPGRAQDPSAIKVVVIEGEGAANIVANKIAVRPVVEVRDAGNVPVPDAKVTFILPKEGPRVAFRDDGDTLSIITSINGRARADAMEPIEVGSFRITVNAEYQGRSALVVITQTNYANWLDAPAAGRSPSGDTASYKIQILEGDDGVNIINQKTAVRTLARVVDKNNLPVAAVPVVFAIVYTRRGGKNVFPDGKTALTVMTNADGKAEAPPVLPQGEGSFQIQIQASVKGTILARSIIQTNFLTEAAARSAGKTPGASAPSDEARTNATESLSSSNSGTLDTPPKFSPNQRGATGGGATGSTNRGSGGRRFWGGALAAAGLAGVVGSVTQTEGQTEAQNRNCTNQLAQLTNALQMVLNCRSTNTICVALDLDGAAYSAYLQCSSCNSPGTPVASLPEFQLFYLGRFNGSVTPAILANQLCK